MRSATQRSVLAEANLSLNPQVWAGNAISANYINAVEGLRDLQAARRAEAGLAEQVGGHVARSRDTVNAPTVRTQGAPKARRSGPARSWVLSPVPCFPAAALGRFVHRPDDGLVGFRRSAQASSTRGWTPLRCASRMCRGRCASPRRRRPCAARGSTTCSPPTRTAITPGAKANWVSGIEGPVPASSSDPAWNVLAGGTPNLSPEAPPGQPGQRRRRPARPGHGLPCLLEKYNPFAPFASISEGAPNLWTGMTTTMAGRVPIGEQANYFRTFAQANTMARRDLLPEAFGRWWRGEHALRRDDPVIQALTGEYVRNQMLTRTGTRSGSRSTPSCRAWSTGATPTIASIATLSPTTCLGTFDEYNLSALKAAKAGADNVMLEPTHKTNFDEWVSPFLAFAYFGMHNAYNWIGRSVRPSPLRNFLLFERATAMWAGLRRGIRRATSGCRTSSIDNLEKVIPGDPRPRRLCRRPAGKAGLGYELGPVHGWGG